MFLIDLRYLGKSLKVSLVVILSNAFDIFNT